jgi:hypothetical protein
LGEGAECGGGQEAVQIMTWTKESCRVKNPLRDKRIHRTTIEEEVRLFDYECLIRKLQVQLKTARKDAFVIRQRIRYRRKKEKEREVNAGRSQSDSDVRREVVPVGQPGDY